MQAETSERASCRSDKVSCMLSSAQAQGKPGWSFERPHTPAAPYANKPLQILDAKKKTEEPEIPPAVTKWVWTQCSWPCNLTEGSKMDLDSTLPVKQHWVWVTVISLVMFLWPAPIIPSAALWGQTATLEVHLQFISYLCITVPLQRPVLNNAK